MLHIAIREDERLYSEKLAEMVYRYLAAYGLSCKIDRCDADRALLAMEAGITGYDVVFLDIDKKGIDGLETARWIRQHSETLFLVFVAESDHYAIEGYKENANWYLLKDSESFEIDFQECMKIAIKRMPRTNVKLTFKFRAIFAEQNFQYRPEPLL